MVPRFIFKTLLNKAGTIALGTGFPVEDVSPFLTFYAAVARQDTSGYPKGGFQMEEALTREETLKGMTIWAAYSNFEEEEKHKCLTLEEEETRPQITHPHHWPSFDPVEDGAVVRPPQRCWLILLLRKST